MTKREVLFLLDIDRKLFRQLVSEGKIKKEENGSLFGETFELNDACPRYDQESGKCEIYHDRRRPGSCKSFPLLILDDSSGGIYDIRLEMQCEFVRRNVENIKNYFKEIAFIGTVEFKRGNLSV